MSTGQTLLTIGAFVLLSNILVTFYRLLAESGQTIDGAQYAITMVSLATTYTQSIHSLRYDERTIDSVVTDPNALTPLGSLTYDSQFGVDSPNDPVIPRENEQMPRYFDDVDDFHGQTIRDSSLAQNLGVYAINFKVRYVNPDDINVFSMGQTFVKRVDMKIWRENVEGADTLRTFAVVGYWKFGM